MDIKLGTLKFIQATENEQMLADPVNKILRTLAQSDLVGVSNINPELSDTASFCEYYEVNMNQVANCVVLEAKRGENKWFAACVILANTRADVNGLARRTLDARKVSFAPMDVAVAQTGMEYGAITPIGLSNDWPILIDKAVADSDYVIIGSGIRSSKIAIPGNILASLLNVQVLECLGK